MYINIFINKGSLNETNNDEVAGIKFAILFDDLADNFPEEKLQKLKDLIQSNVSRFACCYMNICRKNRYHQSCIVLFRFGES